MIAAILRAQLLSMRVGFSRGTVISVLAGLVWYGMWCFVAFSLYLAARELDAARLVLYLPLSLAAVFAYWQFVPVVSASMGSGLDMRKLLVYPLAPERLFAVEVILRLVTGLEMVLVAAAGTLGVLLNPAAGRAALWLLPAMAVFILFNLLLASGVRSLVERMLSRRRLREAFFLFVLMLYAVPRMLLYAGVDRKTLDPALAALSSAMLPWTATAHAGVPAAGGSRWLAFPVLAAWTLAAWWFGRLQFERSLRYDAIAAQAGPAASPRFESWLERLYRLPSLVWRDPLGAVVEKEVRSLARTPRFRMIFIMGFTFGLAVWFPAMFSRNRAAGAPQYFLIVVCIYALTLLGQVSYWNAFGFDRSAAVIYFATPQPLRAILIGKNLASMVFVYLEVLVLVTISLAFGLTSGWRRVTETFVVVGICSLYMLGIGNLSSVHYPRGLNPETVARGGGSNRFHGLIFMLYPLALLPVGLAYLARFAFNSQAAFVLVLTVAAAIGAAVYWIATESAAGTALQRREQLLRELARGDGPVATD